MFPLFSIGQSGYCKVSYRRFRPISKLAGSLVIVNSTALLPLPQKHFDIRYKPADFVRSSDRFSGLIFCINLVAAVILARDCFGNRDSPRKSTDIYEH